MTIGWSHLLQACRKNLRIPTNGNVESATWVVNAINSLATDAHREQFGQQGQARPALCIGEDWL
jgi:hypothetical protein